MKKTLAIIVGQGIGNQVQMLPAINEIYKLYSKEYLFDIINSEPHCSFFTKYLFYNKPNIRNIYSSIPPSYICSNYITFPFTSTINLGGLSLNKRNYPHFERMKVSEVQINLEAINKLSDIKSDVYNTEQYFPIINSERIKKYDIVMHNGYNINPNNPNLWKIKLYPNMSKLAYLLNKEYSIACIGKGDEYISGCDNYTNLNIEESIEMIRNCKIFISNDTGTYHIAAALKKKGIAIFTATSHLKNYDNNFHKSITLVRKSNVDCSPCQIKGNGYWLGCNNNRRCCDINEEEIYKLVKSMI